MKRLIILISLLCVASCLLAQDDKVVVIDNKVVEVGGKVLVVPPDWTPADIDTVAWYDVSDISTVTTNGSNISQLDDKSGNDFHLTQASGGAQPFYVEDGIGGLPAMQSFQGDYVQGSATNNYTNNLIAIGVQKYSGGNFSQIWHSWKTDKTDWFVVRRNGTSDSLRGYFQLDGVRRLLDDDAGATALDTPFIYCGSWESGVMYQYIDGSVQADSESLSGTHEQEQIRIGWESIQNNSTVGELIFVDSSDSDTRQKLEGYLAWKWGMEDYLPTDHPYKYERPTK